MTSDSPASGRHRPAPDPDPGNDQAVTAPVCWPSEDLLRGRQVVFIEHRGATYQLRLTRQDKLILTK